MEWLNTKSASILMVLSLLLVGLVSSGLMADPKQEQKECTDPRCPNVDIGGTTVPLDLPAGPGLKVEGIELDLTILGQTLSGDFAFEQTTSPQINPSLAPPPLIPVVDSTPGGIVVTIRGDDLAAGRSFVPGARVFFGSREACGGAYDSPPAPPFGSSRGGVMIPLYGSGFVPGTAVTPGTEVKIANVPLTNPTALYSTSELGSTDFGPFFLHGGAGSDRFLRKNYQTTNGILGSGAGNMYINAAYGTTRADVPVCEIGRGYFVNVRTGAGYMHSSPGTACGSDMAVRFAVSELGPLGVFLSASIPATGAQAIIPILNLHYDSGKADGSIAERQTVLGYGWTHNYNIYLIDKSPDIFMADGKGRMTRFQDNGLGGYLPSDGQTHTLYKLDPNTFLLEEVDGIAMTFFSPNSAPWWAVGNDVFLLDEIEDARGRTIDLSYDANALLETITGPYGRQILLSYADYSGKKLLDTVTDPNMQVTTIDCNDGNDLWQITDPEGYTITYGYDPNHRMTSATLKDGNTWNCEYFGGKPWRITDPNFDTYVTVVNSENWAPDACHPDGNEIRYKPSQTIVTDGEGNITIFYLDIYAYVTTLEHPNHPNESFVFDSNLRLTEIIDQQNNHWLYTYDSNGNLTDINDPLNNHTQLFYEHPTIPSLCTQIIEPDNDVWQFEWDLQANLTKITDPIVESPNDAVISYSYTYYPGPPDGRFQLVTATDRNGNSRQWQFDPNGNIIQTVIDPCGLELTAEYEHDELGRLTKATVYRQAGSPNSVVTEYTYDSMGRLIESVLDPNPLNLTTQYEYDGVGRLVKITNPRGIVTEYKYDYRGRLTSRVFDPCGLSISTNYSYDGCDRRIETIDAEDNQTRYEYDSLNRLCKIVDAEGYWTEYGYDERSNLTLAKRSIDPGIPLYRSVKYGYDQLNRLVQKVTDPCDLKLTTTVEYAPVGGGIGLGTPGTSLVHKTTDAEAKVTYYYYDKLDRLTSVVGKVDDTNDNGGDANDAVIDYEYDSVGNRIRTVVQNAPHPNLVATYGFDAANRLIKGVLDPCDANLVTTYAYDGTGSITSHTTPVGNVATFTFDTANRMESMGDSIGPFLIVSEYDAKGNILEVTSGLGQIWHFNYDSADRMTDACDPLVEEPNDKFTSYQYDKNGNLVKKTDNEGLVTDYEYDALNRLISACKDPCGLNITNTLAYDGLGNVVNAADASGNATIYQYDSANRLVRIEYADSSGKLFGYDGVGNLIDANDRMGNTTTYSYDDLHRMTQRTYADSNSDTFTYDRASRMLSADNSHSHIGYTYDGLGRTLSSTQTDLPQTYSYTVNYAYKTDPNYSRTITYPDGNDVNEIYDVRSRLAQVRHNGSTLVQYTYQNPGNRLITKQFANGTQTELTWNENDLITKLVHKAPDDSNFVGFEYTYDAVGNCLSAENLQQALPYDANKPATRSAVYSYDSIYRLTGFKQGQWVSNDIPSPVRQRSWTLDDVGNWQQFSIQDTLDSSENGTYSNSANQMNEYDDASTNGSPPVPDDDGMPDDFMVNTNPLTGDFQPDGDVDFYDLAVMALHWLDDCSEPGWCDGADIDQSADVNFVDYANLAVNWLDTTPGFYNSTHDKNGNLVDDDILQYYWDYDHRPINTAVLRSRNLLTQVRRKSDSQILGQYWYDALGRRIRKSASGTPTVYVYDGWQVIAEYENSAFARRYAYGEYIDELLTMENAADQRYHFHAGTLRSIDAVTVSDGNVVERYSYDAYGRPSFFDPNGTPISNSAIENPYLFTARRYDDETGLYYYRTRYFNPQRGRFISPDTIGIWADPMALGNGYCYVGNNPINYTDPYGFGWLADVVSWGLETLGVHEQAADVAGAIIEVVVEKKAEEVAEGIKEAPGKAAEWYADKVQQAAANAPSFVNVGGFAPGTGMMVPIGGGVGGGIPGGSGSGGGCFVEGTLVHTPEGLIPIEKIRLGDTVLAMDGEQKVEESLVDMTWQALRWTVCEISIEGELITCSDNHKFFVVGRDWIMARDINQGDVLRRINGETITVRDIQIKKFKKPIVVYNLGVLKDSNFFVTKTGILTHNQPVRKAGPD